MFLQVDRYMYIEQVDSYMYIEQVDRYMYIEQLDKQEINNGQTDEQKVINRQIY